MERGQMKSTLGKPLAGMPDGYDEHELIHGDVRVVLRVFNDGSLVLALKGNPGQNASLALDIDKDFDGETTITPVVIYG